MKLGKAQILIRVYKVISYYADQLKDLVLLSVMVKTSTGGGDWLTFENQFIFAWTLTIVVPFLLNAVCITYRARSSLGQEKRNYSKKTRIGFKVLAFFISWFIPASLIYKMDGDNYESAKVRKDCLEEKQNLSRRKPFLLKKKEEVEEMNIVTTTYKVWGLT